MKSNEEKRGRERGSTRARLTEALGRTTEGLLPPLLIVVLSGYVQFLKFVFKAHKLDGSLVFTKSLTSNEIDISTLSNGSYFIVLSNTDGLKVKSDIFIKQ